MLLMLPVSFLTSFVRVGVLDILYLVGQMDYIEFARIVRISYICFFKNFSVYEIYTLSINHRF